MVDENKTDMDRTEFLIEKLHATRKKNSIIISPDYLDDEKLPEDERTVVLKEIFNRNIREKQLTTTISHLSPILDGIAPQSLLVYGPTGSGKTVTLLTVLSSFNNVARRHNIPFQYHYIDLTTPKTYFSALNSLVMTLDSSCKKYRKGIPKEYMQQKIVSLLKDVKGFYVLLLDEVDNIIPNPDTFLTYLAKTLPRQIHCRLILIMLTNRLDWEKNLDPRILSFLKKSDLIFEPYNAMDLLEILNLRVEKALDIKKVDPVALSKIAALASRETGDSRRAIELLIKAVRVAESEGSGRLSEKEVDIAEDSLEVDKSQELIRSLATQQRIALQACYSIIKSGTRKAVTGQVYEVYQTICQNQGYRPLSQRRFSDMISYLDLYGLINAPVISRGRYGKTREIMSSLPDQVVEGFL